MNERIRMLLLQALEQEGDIGNLEKAGYQYAEIAEVKERLNRNGTWKIEPYVKYKTKKQGRFDIFIE